jgi:DNA-binding transcriptional regulator PaaX
VVRHLQLDPLLPAEFIGNEWPGPNLRSAYRRFDEVFKQRLNTLALRTNASAARGTMRSGGVIMC